MGHYLPRLNVSTIRPIFFCKIFEQIINNLSTSTTRFLRHSQHPSPPVKLSGLNVSKSHATQADKHHGSDVQSFSASFSYGAWKLWRGSCRLSKYDSLKPESTRRMIFNRGSTLQFIVQISSASAYSSVRARAKAHGHSPVPSELPETHA